MHLKNFLRGKVKGFGAIIVVVVLVAIFAAVMGAMRDASNGLIVGKTVAIDGEILAIDANQIAFDGPYIISLRSEEGISFMVKVPSMGRNLCPAYQNNNIGDVSLLKPGMMIEVNGKVSEDGSLVPCESASHYLRTKGMVVDNFSGEADPNRMTLGMKKWNWVSAQYNDGRTITPKTGKSFSIIFGPDGRFSAMTDCNSIGGSYAVGATTKELSFLHLYSTKMYCEGSQETDFITLLENTGSYHFTSRGELILDLKFDSGSVVFR